MNLKPAAVDESAGMILFGMDYATLVLRKSADGLELVQQACIDARGGKPERDVEIVTVEAGSVYLRIDVVEGGFARYSYSVNGKQFSPIGETFKAVEGRWVGAQIGLFAKKTAGEKAGGNADFDFFQVDR